ncbi:MAG TPA: hypothetical protein VFV10_01605 [Gammaproteobacteria bacterium]|nr:hypothetical protein [Gammaproteobacteria bacterium]
MIKHVVVLSISFVLSACASSTSRVGPQVNEAPTSSVPESSAGVEVAQVLEVENYKNHLVCRRQAKLGTRIAHRDCYDPAQQRPENAAEKDLQQQEFQRLRDQQANTELARQQALRQSMQPR